MEILLHIIYINKSGFIWNAKKHVCTWNSFKRIQPKVLM